MTQPTIQERASSIWVEMWKLAGEQWPPRNVPDAWRVYQHLKEALIRAGVSDGQAIAFADDFFLSAEAWGNLAVIDHHKRVIDALTATLLDSELVGMGNE
jgi:hypothetical protein